MARKLRILSLDGGGIRGIIPASVMVYVENKLRSISKNENACIADYFDLVVGTSTGGILSCFYLTPNPENKPGKSTCKYVATQALELYSKKGHQIFNESKYKGGFGRRLFNASLYNPKNLEHILKSEFADLKFNELLKPCLITTYNVRNRTSFFFNSREKISKKRDFFVRDAVRSTSAAPTYFPPAEIQNLATGEKLINLDGGVFANNPTMCAYSEARSNDYSKDDPTLVFTNSEGAKAPPSAKDMLILSIGTGGSETPFKNVDRIGKWGVIPWITAIPTIMMDGSADTVNYHMLKIFDTLGKHCKNYKRIDVPEINRDYNDDMADASPKNIEKLKIAGQIAIKSAQVSNDRQYSLDEFIGLLVDNRPVTTNPVA